MGRTGSGMRGSLLLTPLVAVAVCSACDSVPLVAPTQSTMRLVVSDTSVPNGGSTTITATVTELSGTPVHDGTVVTFSTTLGAVYPVEAPTARGRASSTFTAGEESGTAEVLAYSGGAISEAVQVTIGAAAVASVRVTARPGSLPPAGGTATLIATVFDGAQNPLPNIRVTFAATAGRLRERVVTTDGSGEARTVLATTTAAEVTASVGETSGTTSIAIEPPTVISISATPVRPVAGQVVTFDVTLGNEARAIRRAVIAFGDGRVLRLGATAQATLTHTYARPGSYTVRVTATDVAGHDATASIALQVDPPPAIPVTVTASPTDPVAGQPVTFTVEVSPPDNAPAIRDVTIEFGDDSRASLGALTGRRSVVHVYEDGGSYIVTVEARDATGRRHASSVGVQVRPALGIPVTVTASPTVPVEDEPVTFTVDVSPPAGAPAVRDVTIDFGDESRESLGALTGRRAIVHAYEDEGSYVVTVEALDAAGRRHASSVGVQVRPALGIPVTVTASPTAPVEDEPVTFTVDVSPPAGAPAVRDVTIDFGDESRESLGALTGRRAIVHVYEDEGSYVVTVEALDAAGRRHATSVGVRVRPALGIPVTVTASPTAPVEDEPVTFTVEVSPPAGAPAVRDVTIDFGDESRESLGALTGRRTIVHVYEDEGSYVATVEALDAAGRRHATSVGVQVRPALRIPVTITASPTDPVVDEPVTFTVEVVPPVGAPAVRSVTLDFGDGSRESLGALTGRASVAHAYEDAGSYVVTATVIDAADRRHVSSIGIRVAEQ